MFISMIGSLIELMREVILSLPPSFILSIIVMRRLSLFIDSCSFPLVIKSELKPGIIPCQGKTLL